MDGPLERFFKMRYKYTIEYVFGSYSGTEVVYLDADDDRDPKAVMWANLRRQGKLTLPMAYQSARVVKREEIDEDEEV